MSVLCYTIGMNKLHKCAECPKEFVKVREGQETCGNRNCRVRLTRKQSKGITEDDNIGKSIKCSVCPTFYVKRLRKQTTCGSQVCKHKSWNLRNKVAKAETDREYRANNVENLKDKRKDYYGQHKSDPGFKENRKQYMGGWNKEAYHKDPEKQKVRAREYRQANLEVCRAKDIERYRNGVGDKKKAQRQELRERVIGHYSKGSMECSCILCPEVGYRFTTIDHIEGGGNKHLKTIPGRNLYRWIVKNDFPKGFQVLCMNCNWVKHKRGGVCHGEGIDLKE